MVVGDLLAQAGDALGDAVGGDEGAQRSQVGSMPDSVDRRARAQVGRHGREPGQPCGCLVMMQNGAPLMTPNQPRRRARCRCARPARWLRHRRAHQAPPGPTAPAVAHYEMEPMTIEAKPGADRASRSSPSTPRSCSSRAGRPCRRAASTTPSAFYDKLLTKFPDSPYARPALYNRGLAYRDKKDWPKAIDSFRELAEKYADHADAKDALFQLGACYAETRELAHLAARCSSRLLDRKDLTADDRIEAIARRGFAQFKLGDLDPAERTFRSGARLPSSRSRTRSGWPPTSSWPSPSTTWARSPTSASARPPSACPRPRWTGTSRRRPASC